MAARRKRFFLTALDYNENVMQLGVGWGEDKYSYLVELRSADCTDIIGGTSELHHCHNIFATYNPEPMTFLGVFEGGGI